MAACLVPVIVIFTKFDSLDAAAFHRLRKEGKSRAVARTEAPAHADQEFDNIHMPRLLSKAYPPANILRLRSELFHYVHRMVLTS